MPTTTKPCLNCGADCRYVLCDRCYDLTQRLPLPAPEQTDSSLLWLRARDEAERAA